MSADSFADLAQSLNEFTYSLQGLLRSNKLPAVGSLADKEASGERYAGEWGNDPLRELFPSVQLTAWSCADHLQALAATISIPCTNAPFTLTRAAVESAALACYLTSPEIKPLERIRRNMNMLLDGLCEQINRMFKQIGSDRADIDSKQEVIAAIGRAGAQHGFTFRKQDGHRPAFLAPKPPSAMELMDQFTFKTPGLGADSQRLLSGIAHAKLHGLFNFLHEDHRPNSDRLGGITFRLTISDEEVALGCIVALMCAGTLLEHLRLYAGWDTDKTRFLWRKTLYIWARIAHPGESFELALIDSGHLPAGLRGTAIRNERPSRQS